VDERPPNIEFRATWTGSLNGERVTQTTGLDSKALLLHWATEMGRRFDGFTITKLEDRIVPGWETVPDDSWPEGLR